MTTTPRLLTERRGSVLLITISNPVARNALHPDIYRAGVETMRDAVADDGIAAIVLAGEKGMFCSGGNLKGIMERRVQPEEVQRTSLDTLHAWVTAMRDCEKPIIAGVQGYAAGAGFGLALACDLIVADDDAKFVMSYVKVGLSPDGGGSWWLANLLPRTLASELMFEGEAIHAARLHELGVVNRVCAKGHAVEQALEWAARLASGPRAALGRIKHLASTARENDLATHLDLERESFIKNQRHPDCAEGINAFFEKRRPEFSKKPVE
jgi:enoyl-CoA hydratase/carnithine racemase